MRPILTMTVHLLPPFLLLIASFELSSCTIIQTTHGTVEGDTANVYNGKRVSAFLGIPYADAPTGQYRFSPPRPLTAWNGTLQTKTLPNSCYQMVTNEMKVTVWYVSESEENEDCLYLNLWKPESSEQKLPVMIWIHPGAFSAGSTNIPLYDGSVLASEGNVIVVSINYRLSVFGFLFLNGSTVPGNAGLRDQIQAIKWVSENAINFGGDPNRITVFGQSAGSSSVGFHIINPEINGLIQNAIMQSGASNTLVPASKLDTALRAAAKLAKALGCLAGDNAVDDGVLNCLRTKTPEQIRAVYLPEPTFYNLNQFVPINNDIELALDPVKSTKTLSSSLKINLISGDIPSELTAFLESYFPGKSFDDHMTISELELRTFLANIYGLKDEKLQDLVLSQYTNLADFCDQKEFRLETAEILTDSGYTCPQVEMTKDWSGGLRKAFYFDFTHKPSIRVKNYVPDWAGSVHGDELPFVFGAPLDRGNGYTEMEANVSKMMINYWTNFAKYGNPNGETNNGIEWPQVDKDSPFIYLDIGVAPEVKTALKERECMFWKKIYPIISNS